MNNVKDLLEKSTVCIPLNARTGEEALTIISEALFHDKKIKSSEMLYNKLIEREKLTSTGIGRGIAIPHTDLPNLDEVVMAVGKSSDGIEFKSLDNKKVHLFFVLVSPEREDQSHLKLLARLARLLKDNNVRRALLEAESSSDIRNALHDIHVEA